MVYELWQNFLISLLVPYFYGRFLIFHSAQILFLNVKNYLRTLKGEKNQIF